MKEEEWQMMVFASNRDCPERLGFLGHFL